MGGLFSKPKMPPPQEPTRMPVEGDQDAKAAERRRRNEALAVRGRESTDLTGGYSGTDLGA